MAIDPCPEPAAMLTLMTLPPAHPQRLELNDEVHARPPEALVAPLRLSYLALFLDAVPRDTAWQAVHDLAARFSAPPPAPGATHYSVNLGPFRIKWEQHTEFARYKFIVAGADAGDPFASPAIDAVPADWLAALPGQTLVAAHVALLPASAGAVDPEEVSARLFHGNPVIGATVAGDTAVALTDFRIHPDGFSRVLVQDAGTTPRQAGRLVQRLMEIDTYRMLALMALPVARGLAPFLSQSEQELAEITAALVQATEVDEAPLLERLTRLEAAIEHRQSTNMFRFSAAAAYYRLVQQRTAELREERLPGLSNFRDFTDRRLAPAMATARAVAARQESLSRRLARATQLLSTRVDLTRERQNQALLESVDRRAKLQLRLQETVEGLSAAALTYYVVGLVGYAAKGLKAAGVRLGGLEVDPELAMAVSIPLVALVIVLGVRRLRHRIMREA